MAWNISYYFFNAVVCRFLKNSEETQCIYVFHLHTSASSADRLKRFLHPQIAQVFAGIVGDGILKSWNA